MNFFVVLPDQLFSMPENIEFLMGFDELYFIEDPVLFAMRNAKIRSVMSDSFRNYYQLIKSAAEEKSMHAQTVPKKIKYISRLKALTRGGAYVDKKEGGGGEKEFTKTNAESYQKYETAPCFIEYFIGMTKQFNMWYPSNHWLWGDRIRDTTFNGLPINFHESPQFLFTFEEVRKFYTRGNSYSERVVIKGLFSRFGISDYTLPPAIVGSDLPIIYHLECDEETRLANPTRQNSYFPNDRESALLLLNNFIGKYSSEYSKGYMSPQIEYSLGVGLITPIETIKILKKIHDAEQNENKKNSINAMTYFIFRREYMRIIYISNSDLMLDERLAVNISRGANTGSLLVQKLLKDISPSTIQSNLCSEKSVAMYMQECALNGLSSWETCVFLIDVAANTFPWNLLPRSLGASIKLNSIKGDIKHYRSAMVVPDCSNIDHTGALSAVTKEILLWKKKNIKILTECGMCNAEVSGEDNEKK